MNKSKILCLLSVLFLIGLPQETFGKEIRNNEVGIGFTSELNDPKQIESETSMPVENVLPLTITNKRSSNYYRSTRIKTFPRTGDQTSFSLRIWGIVCVIAVFWLFLFNQLREEEENE